MLEQALKARLPLIYAYTEDTVYVHRVFQELTGGPVSFYEELDQANDINYQSGDPPSYLLVLKSKISDREMYLRAAEVGRTIVLLNPGETSVGFEGGEVPTPLSLLYEAIEPYVVEDEIEKVAEALSGMTIKQVCETLQLVMADGGLNMNKLRDLRSAVIPRTPGIELVDPSQDLYMAPADLVHWVETNKKFFLESLSDVLRPRGLLAHGIAGTGKTMAAKYIADTYDVPLYRLDLAASLSKWQGESESRLKRALAQIDHEAPCVFLIDEVEKLFKGGEDSGSTGRMLASLLWWLQEHTSRVLTVMTTNDKGALPPELYRSGRVDIQITFDMWPTHEARQFALNYLDNLNLPSEVREDVHATIESIDPEGFCTIPADVVQWVLQTVKESDKWQK